LKLVKNIFLSLQESYKTVAQMTPEEYVAFRDRKNSLERARYAAKCAEEREATLGAAAAAGAPPPEEEPSTSGVPRHTRYSQ
jgi:tryptophan 2,3-dioxygenase